MTSTIQAETYEKAIKAMPGLEFLKLSLDRNFPQPEMARTMNFRLSAVDDGVAILDCTPGDRHLNHLGAVHGGWAMTALDAALGVAVQSTLPARRVFTTLETKVNMVRAIRPNLGSFRCEAHAVHVGKQTGTAEARLLGEDGTLFAHGSSTCLILEI